MTQQTPSTRPPADTVVLTGASGWLGQNMARELVASGQRSKLRCLVPDAEHGPPLELLSDSVDVVVGDVRDPAALDRLFEDTAAATVFHVAGVVHADRFTRQFFDVNTGGTQMVLDRARRAGVGRFVHVSSNSPFGANPTPDDRFDEDSPYNPYMAYGESKLAAEQHVRKAHDRGDLAAVIVRPPWIYGPYQPDRQRQFFTAIRKGRFPILGDGSQRRSMVFTGNLVNGLLCAEQADEAPGNAYWVADAEPYRLVDIVSTVRDALAAEGYQVTTRTPRLPRVLGEVAEKVDGFIQGRGRYLQAVHVLGELKDTIACDIGRARKELGYDPQFDLLDGMRASIRWCQERGVAL